MRQVWQTVDGQVFDRECDARLHEEECDKRDNLAAALYDSTSCDQKRAAEVAEWLMQHYTFAKKA